MDIESSGKPLPDSSLVCSTCGRKFTPQYAYQVAVVGPPSADGASGASGMAQRRFYCKLECRRASLGESAFAIRKARRIAILNQKGGTGKTTTAINLAAGLAERGHETLLIDTDAQGNVGASLGVKGERSLYHVIVEGAEVADLAVPVRNQLDVVTRPHPGAAAGADAPPLSVHRARLRPVAVAAESERADLRRRGHHSGVL
jgi:Mrp family chromosome partitioning ATPase